MLSLTKTDFTMHDVLSLVNNNSGKKLHTIMFKPCEDPLLTPNQLQDEGYNEHDAQHQYYKNSDTLIISNIMKQAKGLPLHYEYLLNMCFDISYTFYGNSLWENKNPLYCPVFYPEDTRWENPSYQYSTPGEYYIYSRGSYMIIFPESGVRISATREFIQSIPYLSNIVNGDFSEDCIILTVQMVVPDENYTSIDDPSAVFIEGPTIYICHAPLDMLLYESTKTFNNTAYLNVSLDTFINRIVNNIN